MSTFTRYDECLMQLYSLTHTKQPYTQQQLAKWIGISAKQLSRYIERLHEEQFVRYTAGKGRTHRSTFVWQHAAQLHVQQLVARDGAQIMHDIVNWCNALPHDQQQDVTSWLQQHVIRMVEQCNDALIIQLYQPVLSLHPLHACDYYAQAFVTNLYNRLVAFQGAQIVGDLAVHWDVHDEAITFYLRKFVQFHNGTMLNAYHVAHCFAQHGIKTSIEHEYIITCFGYELAYFTQPQLSIFLQHDKQLYGTGAFQLTTASQSFVQLSMFPYYFNELALVQHIYIVQIPRGVAPSIQSDAATTFSQHPFSTRETYIVLNENSPYFQQAQQRDAFLKAWTSKQPIRTKAVIGVSKHKQALNEQLASIYRGATFRPMTLSHYVNIENWGDLDAIMVTQSFLQHNETANLLDLQSTHNIFRKLLPMQPAFEAVSVAQFLDLLQQKRTLLVIDQTIDYIFISDDVVTGEAPLLMHLQKLWKKEAVHANVTMRDV